MSHNDYIERELNEKEEQEIALILSKKGEKCMGQKINPLGFTTVRTSHPTHNNLTDCNEWKFHQEIQDENSYQDGKSPTVAIRLSLCYLVGVGDLLP